MGDRSRGVYLKYEVHRTDGSHEPGGKHYGCRYFVLDVDCDPHAVAALRAYADSCAAEYPRLSLDVKRMALDLEQEIKDRAEDAAPCSTKEGE
ncbi:MAG: hypothetical protein V3S01_09575 [Dehalococcoidia bacterium]